MSTSTLGLFLRHLALSEEVSRLETVSDHNLLAAYEAERGQAAFTELMRRHGPMVLRTCRRVLDQEADAEDAFQATFILLAGKAGSISKREALGGWLHRVAYHTALKVLRGAGRRRVHERQADGMPHAEPDPITKATWNEIRPILDAELDALPDEARRLLIACYLEERTYAEAAAELRLPPGSIGWHLQRARTLLATRLALRGITVSSVLLAILLEDAAKGAGVPAVLLVHTVEVARTFTEQAAGIVSDNVARLVKGGLAQMAKGWTHWSMVLAGWVGLLGAGLLACQTLKAWPGQTPQSEPPAATAAKQPAQEGTESAHIDRYGDPLPTGALARMGTTRLRHANQVCQVLFAPDGKTVASVGTDDTVRLWDAATGKLVCSLKHPARIRLAPYSLCFSHDGKTLVSVTGDRIARWDARTGEPLHERKLRELEPNQPVRLGAISSDGKIAVSSWEQGKDIVRLWDAATGNPLRALNVHKSLSRPPFFSSDNKMLAMVTDKLVELWDVSSGELLHTLSHPRMIWTQTVVFSPDGKKLASGGTDKSMPERREGMPSAVRLWDVATGKLLRTLEGHQQFITALVFSRDGKMLASWGWDRTIRLWDVTSGKEIHKLKCQVAMSLSFSPDGKVLASGGNGPAVRLWDVTTGQELHRAAEAHKVRLHSISFAPDGRTLATAATWWKGGSAGGVGTIRIWDAASGKPLQEREHPEGIYSVAFAPDGKTLASGGEGAACIWDAILGKQLRQLKAPSSSPLVFSPDGKLLAAGSDKKGEPGSNRFLRLWDVSTGTQIHAMEHPDRVAIRAVAFSPDGKTLAVGTWRRSLYLWSTVTGKQLLSLHDQQLPPGCGPIMALSFSPDGMMLAVGSYPDNRIYLLEVSTGKVLHTLSGHSSYVSAVAFSPNGQLLASGSADRTVRLWDVKAEQTSECHRFRGHDAEVTAVAFSPDGRRLASSSEDSTALVWDVTGLAGEPIDATHSMERQTRAARLTHGELTACWRSLASTDGREAYQALRALAAVPDQAVPFLAERLYPKKPDPQQVAHLLADLDSDDFGVRSKAAKEWEKWGEAGEPALRQALQDNPSLEARRRIQQLLAEIAPQGVSQRRLRAVEILAWTDTSAAREVLMRLAADSPQEEVCREAKAVLKRLHARPQPDKPGGP